MTRLSFFGFFATLCCLACSSDEEKVKDLVVQLAQQIPLRETEPLPVRALRIQSEFRPVFPAQIDIMGSLVPPMRYEREEVLGGLTSLNGHRIAHLTIEDVDVRIESNHGTARVRGVGVFSESQPGDLHASRAKFELDLLKQGGAYVIERVWLDDPRQDLPEARP
jgi:hypothetical protein